MYQRILAPLDGSAFSEQALPVAAAIAGRTSATLHLAIVHEPLPIDTLAQDGSYLDTQLRRWQEEYLHEVSSRVEEGGARAPVTDVMEGPAAPTLEAYAAEKDIDLIVMATHGRGGLTRAWLGSGADRLIRHVIVPILLIRPDEDEPAEPPVARETLFRRIVVPLDGSPLGEAVLGPATQLGGLEDAEFDLVRAVGSPMPIGPRARAASAYPEDRHESKRQEANTYLTRVADRLRQGGTRQIRTSVPVAGTPATAILEHASQTGADLIAMSTHGHGRIARTLLGSHADKVVRAAEIAVLIYLPGGA
jgi:nucleotide-binding universal stress UspA family protein